MAFPLPFILETRFRHTQIFALEILGRELNPEKCQFTVIYIKDTSPKGKARNRLGGSDSPATYYRIATLFNGDSCCVCGIPLLSIIITFKIAELFSKYLWLYSALLFSSFIVLFPLRV